MILNINSGKRDLKNVCYSLHCSRMQSCGERALVWESLLVDCRLSSHITVKSFQMIQKFSMGLEYMMSLLSPKLERVQVYLTFNYFRCFSLNFKKIFLARTDLFRVLLSPFPFQKGGHWTRSQGSFPTLKF